MSSRHLIYSIVIRLAIIWTAAAFIYSCSSFPYDDDFIDWPANEREHLPTYPERAGIEQKKWKNVFIVYSMGYNNLSQDLNLDIDEMLGGEVPYFNSEDAVLILNQSIQGFSYRIETSPVIYQASRNADGTVLRDTLVTYPKGTVAATRETLEDALSYIRSAFPADHYGLLMSSHATGWAPEMYCYSPPDKSSNQIWLKQGWKHTVPEKYTDERPLTRSVGAHFNGGSFDMDEIELADLADAIPFHLDYLLFDCCFMGGVEVAYELKDKCDVICFSQTEILAGGMDYKNLLSHLFEGEEPDIASVALDYYNMYAKQSSTNMRSATISVVDCRLIDRLVPVVSRNADLIRDLSSSNEKVAVQQYFQSKYTKEHGIFYDFEDILIKAGTPEADLDELKRILEECLICRYSTETFLTDLVIRHHSGLSMYLQDWDRKILNKHYKTLKWNQATGLITDIELNTDK